MDEKSDPPARRFVRCIRNDAYPVALELHRLYPVLSDPMEQHGLVRIVDETGDSALYPREYFRTE